MFFFSLLMCVCVYGCLAFTVHRGYPLGARREPSEERRLSPGLLSPLDSFVLCLVHGDTSRSSLSSCTALWQTALLLAFVVVLRRILLVLRNSEKKKKDRKIAVQGQR
eukprot:RCo052692